MIKILIAEDEIPLLRGLKVLIEQIDSKYNVVKCAKNGKEAMQYLQNNSVDVVLTDINMPLVDGVELMEYIHHKNIDVKTVVISGYDKFSYAKQAIQNGAKDYLLKPIVKKDLENVLDQLCKEIELEKRKSNRNIIYANINEGKQISSDSHYYLIHIGYGNIMFQKQSSSIKNMMNDVKLFVDKIIPSVNEIYSIHYVQPQEQLLIISSDNINVVDVSRSIHDYLASKGVHHTLIYDSEILASEELFITTNQSTNALKNHALVEDSTIVEITESPSISYKLNSNSYPDSIDKSYIIVMKKFQQLLDQPITQKNLNDIVHELFVFFSNEGDTSYLIDKSNIENLIVNHPAKKDLFEAINKDENIQKRLLIEPTTEELMVQVEKYILDHLHEPLTVSLLAEHFGFVPPYLSALFKEYYGQTLYQFIQYKRIEKAKKLIKQDDILIKEVSKIVGYHDPLHFSKVFKSKVGLSPSEYQHDIKK